jgi:hypothetical protein
MNQPMNLQKLQEHEHAIILLAEQEAAYTRVAEAAERVGKAADRAIMLKKEYLEMNQADVIPAPQTSLITVITNSARDPGTDSAKLQQLLEMAERLMKFEAERDFNHAMGLCQEEIAPIARTAQNSHTGTAYTKLEAIDREIRPVYTSHGFSMSFGSGAARGEHSVRVTCDVRHSSGHSVRYELEGNLDTAGLKGASTKTGIQGLGSTVTHLRRYLTLMIWNLTLSDPVQTITKEQAGSIWAVLDYAGITGDRRRQFLKFAEAESVETIAIGRYNEVMKMLKRAEAQKRGTAEGVQ